MILLDKWGILQKKKVLKNKGAISTSPLYFLSKKPKIQFKDIIREIKL